MSDHAPLKIALVGPGHIGKRHADAYAKMPDVRMVGVAGVDEADGGEIAQRMGCPAFAGIDALLNAVNVDLVDVCTPTPFHKEGVLKAAQAGKHVICEKP